MLSHGDELGRTQRGNNNAYCQDSELTWVDWRLDPTREAFLAFARRTLALRRAHPEFGRSRFFAADEVRWLRPDGRALDERDWHEPRGRSLGLWIAPDGRRQGVEPRGRGATLLLLNGSPRARRFLLPASSAGWKAVLDTACPGERVVEGGSYEVAAHALVLLEGGA
jgi:glycogen operon protein